MNTQLQKQLLSEKWSPEKLVEKIAENSNSVKEIIDNLNSSEAKLKYRSGKIAILLSNLYPKKVYKYFDNFVELLDSENKIIMWTGIRILGNLSKADSKNKIETILGLLYNQLNTGVMITANITIMALAKIAQAKSELCDEIASELLRVEKYKYETAECSKIAAGFVMEAVEPFIDTLKSKRSAIKFIKSQLSSTRRSTKQKAQELIDKYSK